MIPGGQNCAVADFTGTPVVLAHASTIGGEGGAEYLGEKSCPFGGFRIRCALKKTPDGRNCWQYLRRVSAEFTGNARGGPTLVLYINKVHSEILSNFGQILSNFVGICQIFPEMLTDFATLCSIFRILDRFREMLPDFVEKCWRIFKKCWRILPISENVGRFCQKMLPDFARGFQILQENVGGLWPIWPDFGKLFQFFSQFRPARCHSVVQSCCKYWSVCTRGGGRGNNSAKLCGTQGTQGAMLAAPYDGQRLVCITAARHAERSEKHTKIHRSVFPLTTLSGTLHFITRRPCCTRESGCAHQMTSGSCFWIHYPRHTKPAHCDPTSLITTRQKQTENKIG